MEANGLRVGNYIDTKSFHPPRYRGIYQMEKTWFKYSKQFKGIDLNEDWFLKFGFVIRYFNEDKEKPLWWKVEGNRHIELYFEKQVSSYVYMINSLQYSTEIKYVHQLQNLYFALTGIELKENETSK